MPLHWWEQKNIIDAEVAKVKQTAQSAWSYLREQKRQRGVSWVEAIERRQAEATRQKEMWRSINQQRLEGQAVQDLRNASHALTMAGLGVNKIPITPESIRAQIGSGFTMAQRLARQGESEARAKAKEELEKKIRKDAEAWAKYRVHLGETTWSDYSPAEQEAMIDAEYHRLRVTQALGIEQLPETERVKPKWYERFLPEALQPKKPEPLVYEGKEEIPVTIPSREEWRAGFQAKYRKPEVTQAMSMAIDYALYPFTATGIYTREMDKIDKELGSDLMRKHRLGEELNEEDKERLAQLVQKTFRDTPAVEKIKEWLPGGATYREFRQLPVYKQLYYEAPAWILFCAVVPSATVLRGKLAIPAARGGAKGVAATVARGALAPAAGYEWAAGKVITLPIKGASALTNKALTAYVNKHSLQIARIARAKPEFLGVKDRLLYKLVNYHGHYISMKADAVLKARMASTTARVAGKMAEKTVAQKQILLLDSGIRNSTKTMDKIVSAVRAGKELTPESLTALIVKNTPKDFVKGIGDIIAGRVGVEVAKPVIPEIYKVTRGFEEDTALRQELEKVKGYALYSVFDTPEEAQNVGRVLAKYAEDIKYVQHISKEGAVPTWEIYTKGKLPSEDVIRAEVTPAEVGLITPEQTAEIEEIAKGKLLITDEGKTTFQFRRLARAMVGKTKIKDMTGDEAKFLTEALEHLPEPKYGKPPKIPITKVVITKEFAEKIPLLQEVGVLRRVRPARAVFEKMGLYHEVYEPSFFTEVLMNEERVAFEKELIDIEKLVPKERRATIFRALEYPEKKVELSPDEQRAVVWFRKYFDDWADKLDLPETKRRVNYITHIFEEDMMQQLKTKHPLDIELIRSFDFFTPKTVFMPYLEKRLGQRMGLIEDPFRATGAYEARALKKYYYEPLIKRIRVYEKYLPPIAAKALREYVTRITGRPLQIDREGNETLKQIARSIEKLPLGKGLADILTKGNVSGLVAYQFTGLLYTAWLGFRPASALKNLTQHGLILAETGPINLAKGMKLALTQEGRDALKHSMVLRSRPLGFLPGIDEAFIDHFTKVTHSKAMAMFRAADKKNVTDAFLAGYVEAKSQGLPHEWAIKRGDEVAERTQYIYTKLGGSMWMQSSGGRILGVLTTWPTNWAELVTRWAKGTPPRVYMDYAKATGKEPLKARPIFNKQFLTYLALVATLYGVQKKTRIRASLYSGMMSLQTIADIFSGNLPGLEWPGGIANIIAGTLTLDKTRIKRGWASINPARAIAIVKQIKDITEGERDWLSFFVYENQEYIKGTRRATRQKEQQRLAMETARNVIAQAYYNKNWDELTDDERRRLYGLYPDLQETFGEI